MERSGPEGSRAQRKAARRAQNKAVFAVGGQLPRWSSGTRPGRAQKGPASALEDQRRAEERAARRTENQAAWAPGEQLPRWSEGVRPSQAGPRTGPPPYTTGADQRRAIKAQQRAANRAAWAASQEIARQARSAAREHELIERRAADRERAAQWHEARRQDAQISGTDHDLLIGGELDHADRAVRPGH